MVENDNYAYPGTRFSKGGYNIGRGQGMTMRDYFAGQALAGDLANGAEGAFGNTTADEHLIARADFFYRLADAMIAARTKEPTP